MHTHDIALSVIFKHICKTRFILQKQIFKKLEHSLLNGLRVVCSPSDPTELFLFFFLVPKLESYFIKVNR